MDYKRPSLIHPEQDQEVPGFSFTKDDFEDLIDNFTPFDDIPILLGLSESQLDEFTLHLYNMRYKETYDSLLKRAELYYRKSMFSLSKSGNPTAIKIASEFYVGLGAVDKQSDHITFVGIMPQANSDTENLTNKQKEAADKYEELKKKG